MADKVLKYLSVRIGEQWYGIDVHQVIEVLHLMAFTEAPAHRNHVLGFITVRNEVMPLIDLRTDFGADDKQLRLNTPIIAIREASGPLALLVDDTDRVEELRESEITGSLNSEQFIYIRAVAKTPNRLLFLLDTNLISQEIQQPEVSRSGVG